MASSEARSPQISNTIHSSLSPKSCGPRGRRLYLDLFYSIHSCQAMPLTNSDPRCLPRVVLVGQALLPVLLSNVTHSPLIATPLNSATQCIPPPQDTNPGAASLAPISSDRAFQKGLPYLPVGISHAQRRPVSLQFFSPYSAERISHEP